MIKKLLLNFIAGANIFAIIVMLVVGYSDHLSPESHPYFACLGMVFPFTALVNLLFIPIWVFLSWRRLLIPLIGFLLAFPSLRVYMPLHGNSEPPEGAIRIISYNVAGYGGNYKYENAFDTILSYLNAHQPDIVCTQEDMTSKWLDTQKRYAEYYPYNDTTCISNNGLINCLGIHTRYPILFKEIIDYKSPTNGSVAYYLNIDGDTVIIVNNHLEQTHLTSDDRSRYTEMIENRLNRDVIKSEEQRDTVKTETRDLLSKLTTGMKIRAKHVEIIHQYIEDHSRYPIISCGDFNDTPISYARYTMAKGLTDCFVESGHGLGLSFNRKGFNFRIDHMLCSSHFEPFQCEIDNKMDVSDHYPLLCWLKKREKP